MEYDWTKLALRAIKIGFDKDEQVDKTKTKEQLEQAINLLKESIKLEPEEAWPYIKLADLLSDKQEKIKIYKESIKVDPTDFAKARLYDLLIGDEEYLKQLEEFPNTNE